METMIEDVPGRTIIRGELGALRGSDIARLRKMADLSQAELSERLGVARSTVSSMERKSRVTRRTALALRGALREELRLTVQFVERFLDAEPILNRRISTGFPPTVENEQNEPNE